MPVLRPHEIQKSPYGHYPHRVGLHVPLKAHLQPDRHRFSGTVIGAFRSIRLGGGIRCGANTLITDSDWHPGDPRSGDPRPIVIEDNVWLGAGSTVMKGVTIGRNSVIGAGSVVTKDIPADVIAAGNPCRIIRKLHE